MLVSGGLRGSFSGNAPYGISFSLDDFTVRFESTKLFEGEIRARFPGQVDEGTLVCIINVYVYTTLAYLANVAGLAERLCWLDARKRTKGIGIRAVS